MYDLGQVLSDIPRRAHTNSAPASSVAGSHPHRRFLSRPDFRQVSQFHAAWLEYWKWNATMSFFVVLHRGPSPRAPPRGLLGTGLPDRPPPASPATPLC